MITRPGLAVRLETLCEAKTRANNPLVGVAALVVAFFVPLPQLVKAKARIMIATAKGPDFFKLQAPNYRKSRDLSAK